MAPKKSPRSHDPSLSTSLPTTSRGKVETSFIEREPSRTFRQKCCNYIYNGEKKTIFGRTCLSWAKIITYSVLYLIFLCTYMLVFLILSLWIIRKTAIYEPYVFESLQSPKFTVGLSATPTSETGQPLIWYRAEHPEDYEKYLKSIDNLLSRRKRSMSELGPCGESRYGFGYRPCVILRVNRHLKWAGKPLQANSTEIETVPQEVRNWVKRDKKLWLHCSGHHSYDKEHLGRIRYYPDPPGFDPGLFPPAKDSESQLVAVQISGFTFGISLTIECNLWYENGPSTVEFVLYVSDDRTVFNRSIV